jgi:putative NIF3 family GTP cyclohydrolase 1 type 2
VIKRALEAGCNLILCHEPTFFEGSDKTDWLAGNSVYEAKKKLLDESGSGITRNHDHAHSEKPDLIFSGLIRKLGWTDNQVALKDETYPLLWKFAITEMPLKELAAHVAEKMNLDGIRCIGDPEMKVSTVGIMAHWGGNETDRAILQTIDGNDIQVIIPGEIIDWTIGEYVNDAIALGKKRALLNVGHFNLEEPGQEMMADWVRDAIGDAVPVKFIQGGNFYRWFSK